MSEKIDEKAVELMDKTYTAVEQFANKLEALAKQHGPDVWDFALTVARVDAAQSVVVGVACLIVAIVAYRLARTSFSRIHTITREKGEAYHNDEEIKWIFGATISSAVSIITGVISLITLADIWVWVGVIEPKLWLAKKALGL